MYVPPLKMIRASPEGTNQSREAPVPIIFKFGISVFILHSELAFPRTVSTPHSLPNHHPLTILLPEPLPRAQTRLQATGTRTEEKTSSHAHPTSASSNPFAHSTRVTNNSFTVAGEGGVGQGVRGRGDFQENHCGSCLQRNLAMYRGRSSGKRS